MTPEQLRVKRLIKKQKRELEIAKRLGCHGNKMSCMSVHTVQKVDYGYTVSKLTLWQKIKAFFTKYLLAKI